MERERPSLIVLDPPRAGIGLEAASLLNRIAAPALVYVSCDPTTLARDLGVLREKYSIASVCLIDLFPQTFHMETVVRLKLDR
jgi:23S rRNA (uracil1939-C5)-methyltransferase